MTTVTKRRPHRTMQTIEKLMSRSKIRDIIHPAYHQLILRKQRRCRRTKRKLTAAQKIIDNALHYSPVPCIRPFLCHNCGMSSCNLDVIRHHQCGRKIGGLLEYSNWKRVISHGYRSKAKDALAVLETIPYPQMAKIKQYKAKKHEEVVDGPVAPVYNPKSLADYAYAAFQLYFSQPTESFIVNGPHKAITRDILIDKDDGSLPRRLGYYCFGCRRIFRPYFAYDEHLEEHSKCSKFVEPLEVDITSYFPLQGHVIAPTVAQTSNTSLTCTRCHFTDFKTTEMFHEHIFECARNPTFDSPNPTPPLPAITEASTA